MTLKGSRHPQRRSKRIKKLTNVTNIPSDQTQQTNKKKRRLCEQTTTVQNIPPPPTPQPVAPAVITPVSSIRSQRKLTRDLTILTRTTQEAIKKLDIERQVVVKSNKRDREVENSHITRSCDKEDLAQSNTVITYVDDIYNHYKNLERTRPTSLYMHTQQDINSRMRAILIDWLVEVHLKFKLATETLYLCVSLIDRYLCQNSVLRSKLQLVGVTALLIACKYEEIYCPCVRDCSFITDHSFSKYEIRAMEIKMLSHFEFNVTTATSYHFLPRFLRIAQFNIDSEISLRAQYFIERCLQEHEMLAYRPSLIAAAGLYLAASMQSKVPWCKELEVYSGYCEDQVVGCARLMSHHVNTNAVTASQRALNAVKKKFEQPKYSEVANDPPPYLV